MMYEGRLLDVVDKMQIDIERLINDVNLGKILKGECKNKKEFAARLYYAKEFLRDSKDYLEGN